MNRAIFILFIWGYQLSRACESGVPTKWSGEGLSVEICYDQKEDAFLSAQCLMARCWAQGVISKKEIYLGLKKRDSLQQPGSESCRAVGGKILILKNSSKAESCFCKGPDGSMIDANSLARILESRQN